MGKLRSLFFEEDESKSSATQKASIVPKPKDIETHLEGVKVDAGKETTSTETGEGKVRPEVLDKLEVTLRQENIPGPDYFELKEAAESSEAIANEPDRKKRWRQVYASMRLFFPAANITLDKMTSSVDHYVKVVEAAKKDGNAEVERKLQEQVVAPREKIVLEEQELSRQEQELLRKRAEIETRKQAISEREVSLVSQSKDFNVSADFLIEHLKDDKSKMIEYLKD